jgi:hypothetical protein
MTLDERAPVRWRNESLHCTKRFEPSHSRGNMADLVIIDAPQQAHL